MSNYKYNTTAGTYDIDLTNATIYTSPGANGTWSASSVPWSITTGVTASTYNWNKPSAKLDIKGDDADILVNGKSLCQAIEAIESRLGLLRPAPELEREWDELKRLGDEYRAMEADIRAKMEVWAELKKDHGQNSST